MMNKISQNRQSPLSSLLCLLFLCIALFGLFLWAFYALITTKIFISVDKNSSLWLWLSFIILILLVKIYCVKIDGVTSGLKSIVLRVRAVSVFFLPFSLFAGLVGVMMFTGFYTNVFGTYTNAQIVTVTGKDARKVSKGYSYTLYLQKGETLDVREHLYNEISMGDVLTFRPKCSVFSCLVDEDEILTIVQ